MLGAQVLEHRFVSMKRHRVPRPVKRRILVIAHAQGYSSHRVHHRKHALQLRITDRPGPDHQTDIQ